MGVYDTVYFNCPNCGKQFELQPKPEDATCRHFDFPDVPPNIHDALEAAYPLHCDCGIQWAYSKEKGLYDWGKFREEDEREETYGSILQSYIRSQWFWFKLRFPFYRRRLARNLAKPIASPIDYQGFLKKVIHSSPLEDNNESY